MMFANFLHGLGNFLALCGLLLASASCTLVEKRIDRSAEGPNVPADTDVRMHLEPGTPSEERTKPGAAVSSPVRFQVYGGSPPEA